MTSVSAKEVTKGMIFEVTNRPDVEFGFPDTNSIFTKVIVPIGTRIEVTKAPFKEEGIRFVAWRQVGDTEEYVSHWETFKENSKFISGVKATVIKPAVLSTGAFAGFDLSLAETKIEDYTSSLGFGQMLISISFDGIIMGAKKITTDMIKDAKRTVGFRDKLLEMIKEEMMKNKAQIESLISKVNRSAYNFKYEYENRRVMTWYKNGKLEVSICIMDDFETILKDVEKQIDHFIASKRTNNYFLA